MNREIKFRAWDETFKKMISWNDFLKTNMKNTFIAPESTGMILMQYTGLKDKNGVEIYEGDIVKVDGSGNNDAEINEVVFYRGAFCFTNRKEIYPLFTGLNYCCEVIGNVFENGELLKEGEE